MVLREVRVSLGIAACKPGWSRTEVSWSAAKGKDHERVWEPMLRFLKNLGSLMEVGNEGQDMQGGKRESITEVADIALHCSLGMSLVAPDTSAGIEQIL